MGVDVTALKEAQQLLEDKRRLIETVLDQLPVSMQVTRPNGQVYRANKKTFEIWGAVASGDAGK